MKQIWKQPTPAMQHAAIIMSLDGNYHNWSRDIIGDLEFSSRMKDHISQLKELQPFLEKGCWE